MNEIFILVIVHLGGVLAGGACTCTVYTHWLAIDVKVYARKLAATLLIRTHFLEQ